MSIKTVQKKKTNKKKKKEIIVDHTFKMEDIITPEEKAVMYGVSNGQMFDKKDINNQLVKARDLK